VLSNGTTIDITHVTSDNMGQYQYTWTPPAQDTYKIIATFDGSGAYYSSTGETGLSVAAASSTPSPLVAQTPSPTTAPTPLLTTTPSQSISPLTSPSSVPQPASGIPMTVYIAIASAVVIIIVAVAAIVLRKRK